MRVRRGIAVLLLAGITVPMASRAHAQDFDPRGRRKPPPARPGTRPPPARPGTSPTPGPRGAPSGPRPGDGGNLVERYTRIVLAQPGQAPPLQRLAQLYRERDGNLKALVADFEARVAKGGDDVYAARVTLAGVYKLEGRDADAVAMLEAAIAEKKNDPIAKLTLARLLQDRGDVAAARRQYEEALAAQTTSSEKEATLRTLMGLALDAKDWVSAKQFHAALVKLTPQSSFVRGELGHELFGRGEWALAEKELGELVQWSQGDNRALAPALRDLGKAQAKGDRHPEALATLKKALAVAGQEAAVRTEIYETIAEIYRKDQKLPLLVKELEAEHPGDFTRLALLGALYEETGDAPKAMEAYRRALAVNPRHVDLRLKMIRVMQSQGDIDKAIAEYEALIRAAPNNPTFVFEQCEALMQRGDRTRALRLLAELEARGQSDEEVLSRLADFYGRIGENDKALRVLSRLASVAGADPGHLVDLGDRHFQDGNVPLAVSTWKRILTTVTPRSRALAALGEVYLEHDMTQDALAAFREAASLEPQNAVIQKQLASALERTKHHREARVIWQELAAKAQKTNDKLLAREARTRIVTLWGFERLLEAQVAPLTQRLAAKPPDIEAGRMLAEVQLHLRRLPDAEATLRKVLELAPGDDGTYLALERVLVQENKLDEAIHVLERLATLDPKSARQLYQRMAQYAAQIYKDDDAIRYAARAVELSPDDAEGHHRLGDMYLKRQDEERAIANYRAAIAKNDRLFVVHLKLGELLLARGAADEADRLFRRVLRGAPDEELVARAARLSMQLNLGRGTLESLERELLPLAIGNPQKKIYRRLLVDIYGSLTFALVQRSTRPGQDGEDARADLARIGARAIKPLLDALADGDGGQQRIAIDVLGHVQNRNAGPALFAFASGPADAALRTRAMVACGRLRDPSLLPKIAALVFPRLEGGGEGMASDTVAEAASWAAARVGDRRALPLLRKIAKNGTPSMRAYALLGLGLLRDRSDEALLASAARSADAGPLARAAAAHALGEMGAENEATTLVTLAEGTEILPRQMAVLALGRLGAAKGEPPGGKQAVAAIAAALFAGDAESSRSARSELSLRDAAAAALAMLATRGKVGVETAALPPFDESVDVETSLERLVPRGLPAEARARAVVTFGEPLTRAAERALATSEGRARAVLRALGAGDGALDPLLLPVDDREVTKDARARARVLAETVLPAVAPLARHPDPHIRNEAIVLLARARSDEAAAAVADAVSDPSEAVQRVALAAVGLHGDARTAKAVAAVLQHDERWAMRVLAAEALGRLGKAGGATVTTPALVAAVDHEPYALVREAALTALATYDAPNARLAAARLAKGDPEPRVRDTARRIAGSP